MFISADMCVDVKCFVWFKSSFKLPKVRTTRPSRLFSSRQMCFVFGPSEPGNETRFADWPVRKRN